MTICEELRTLARQFPQAEELAVSSEMLERYEDACASVLRFCDHAPLALYWGAADTFRGRVLQRTPFRFRCARLTLVERLAEQGA